MSIAMFSPFNNALSPNPAVVPDAPPADVASQTACSARRTARLHVGQLSDRRIGGSGGHVMGRAVLLLLGVTGVLLAGVNPCFASPLVYECAIKTEYRLNDGGVITSVPRDVASSLGERFMVDRRTGRITGVGTDNKVAKEFRVIQQGDASHTFAVTSTYWGGTTDYLQVNEFAPTPEKPFLLVFKGFWINGGTCR